MQVKCRIDKDHNRLIYSWNKHLQYSTKNDFYIQYPNNIDLTKTPETVRYFMFGLLTNQIMSWNHTNINLPVITKKQLNVLNDYIYLNKLTNHERNTSYLPNFHYNNISTTELSKLSSKSKTITIANGLGKDGLSQILLSEELGYHPIAVTVGNQYRTKELWQQKLKISREFLKLTKTRSHLIFTDFMKAFDYRIISWFVFLIPINYHYNTNAILSGHEITFNQVNNDGFIDRPDLSTFFMNDISRAINFQISSLTAPLTTYGVQKLMIERYPQYLKYQQSCMHGYPCGKCSKCMWLSLFSGTIKKDGHKLLGLSKFNKKTLPHDYASIVEIHNVWKKYRGQPYEDWFEKASEPAFDYVWNGDKVKKIIGENFDFYDHDTHSPEKELSNIISKWGDWMSKPLIEDIKPTKADIIKLVKEIPYPPKNNEYAQQTSADGHAWLGIARARCGLGTKNIQNRLSKLCPGLNREHIINDVHVPKNDCYSHTCYSYYLFAYELSKRNIINHFEKNRIYKELYKIGNYPDNTARYCNTEINLKVPNVTPTTAHIYSIHCGNGKQYKVPDMIKALSDSQENGNWYYEKLPSCLRTRKEDSAHLAMMIYSLKSIGLEVSIQLAKNALKELKRLNPNGVRISDNINSGLAWNPPWIAVATLNEPEYRALHHQAIKLTKEICIHHKNLRVASISAWALTEIIEAEKNV